MTKPPQNSGALSLHFMDQSYGACCASLFRRRYAACLRALPGQVLAFRRFAEAKEKETRRFTSRRKKVTYIF